MVARLNIHLVGTIRLLDSSIPDNIISTIDARPSWQKHFTNSLWTAHSAHDNIKTTCCWIIIGNRESSLWFSDRNSGCCATNPNHLAIILKIVKVDMILTSRHLMVASLNASPVGTIGLLGRCVPNKVISTLITRPNRQMYTLDAKRTDNIRHNNIEAARIRVVVLNFQSSFRLSC